MPERTRKNPELEGIKRYIESELARLNTQIAAMSSGATGPGGIFVEGYLRQLKQPILERKAQLEVLKKTKPESLPSAFQSYMESRPQFGGTTVLPPLGAQSGATSPAVNLAQAYQEAQIMRGDPLAEAMGEEGIRLALGLPPSKKMVETPEEARRRELASNIAYMQAEKATVPTGQMELQRLIEESARQRLLDELISQQAMQERGITAEKALEELRQTGETKRLGMELGSTEKRDALQLALEREMFERELANRVEEFNRLQNLRESESNYGQRLGALQSGLLGPYYQEEVGAELTKMLVPGSPIPSYQQQLTRAPFTPSALEEQRMQQLYPEWYRIHKQRVQPLVEGVVKFPYHVFTGKAPEDIRRLKQGIVDVLTKRPSPYQINPPPSPYPPEVDYRYLQRHTLGRPQAGGYGGY